MKGVHAMHKKGKEEKRKQQDEEVIAGKEANGIAPSEGEKETTTSPIIRQDYAMDSDEKEDEARASQSNTPIPHRHMHPAGPKGWSSMLDGRSTGPPVIEVIANVILRVVLRSAVESRRADSPSPFVAQPRRIT
jgi:protein involved in temperature-dependent protein secretion